MTSNVHTNKLTSDLDLPSPPVSLPLPQLHLPPLLLEALPFLLLLTSLFPPLLFSKGRLHPPRFCAPIFRRAKQTVSISLPISSLTQVAAAFQMLIDPLFALLFRHIFSELPFWFGWNLKPFDWFTNREMCKTSFPGFILQRSSSLRCASLHLFSPLQLPRPAGVPPELRQRLQQLQGHPQLVCGHAGEWASGWRCFPFSSMLGGFFCPDFTFLEFNPERKCQRSLMHV